MAQESFEQLLNAVKQAESQGKRFDEKGNLLTSPKGAQGEMQVMPKTALKPGYGVAPAQDKSPDELARVGKDYLAAMLGKYGDREKALIAYNWGPKNTDDWLASGADPKKLPAETQSYVQKINGMLGGTKTTATKPTEPTNSEKMMTDALKSGMSAKNLVQEAGPGYKAAMAMMFLADDKPETTQDDIWKEAEPEVVAEEEVPSPLASLDLTYKSPFPAQKPVPVQRLASGGMPFTPKAGVKGTAREALDAVKAEYDKYTEDANRYNTALDTYKAEVYNPYTKKVDEYNAALEQYKAKTYNPYAKAVEDYNAGLDKYKQDLYNPYAQKVAEYNAALEKYNTDIYSPYLAEVEKYNTGLEKYNKDVYTPYSTALDAYNKAAEAWNAGDRTTAFDKVAPTLDTYFIMKPPTAPEAFSGSVPTAPEAFAGTAPAAPEAFSVAAPTLAKTFDLTAPTAPKTTQADYDAMVAAARQDATNRQQALDVASNPEAYGLSINKLFSHGGAVHRSDGSPEYGEIPTGGITDDTRAIFGRGISASDALKAIKQVGTDVGRGALSNAESLLRGSVSQVPGLVGDLEKGGRQLMNFSFGPGGVKVSEKTVAPTSEEIRGMVPRATAARPESSGMESLGEVMAPGFGKAAAPVAKTVGKEAARQMLRGMEGEGMLAPISPPMAYAVKPRGGTFATSGSLDQPALSKFDELLDKYAGRAMQEVPDESKDIVREFIDKKARKYFTTEFGTGDDALRTALRSGELPVAGRDLERFPPYLLEAARNPNAAGHDIAKRHLEKFYDEQANIDAVVLGLHDASDGDARRMFNAHMQDLKEQQRQLMTAEGVPNEFQNPSMSSYALSELTQYPSSTRVLNNLMQAGEEGRLPSGVQGALQRQQPVYDISQPYSDFLSPQQVAENISVLPANKLKNMSFADAMIEGSKKMKVYRDYDSAVLQAEKSGTVPKEVAELFTKPFLKGTAGEWKQITDPRATKLEGKLMNHSVGGYAEGENYGTAYTGLPYGGKKAFDEGLVKVYSLRDEKGLPTVTVEMAKSDAGKGDKWNVTQIRSRFNSEPSQKYWEDIFKFLEKGDAHLGQIKQNSYNMDATGKATSGSVVNWGAAYRDWKDGIDPTQGVQRSSNPPGWGQANLAAGGAVERHMNDNRRYL